MSALLSLDFLDELVSSYCFDHRPRLRDLKTTYFAAAISASSSCDSIPDLSRDANPGNLFSGSSNKVIGSGEPSLSACGGVRETFRKNKLLTMIVDREVSKTKTERNET